MRTEYLHRSMVSACALLAGALLLWSVAPARAALYYVNDASTNGDVYCSAVGNDGNSGAATNLPKLTVTNLLATYTLLPGDVVYIDTGTHSNYSVFVTNSGSLASPIRFQGSTNYQAGGTLFDRRSSGSDIWLFLSVSNVQFADVAVRGGNNGIFGSFISSCEFERVTSVSNFRSFFLFSSSGNRFRRCAAARSNTGFELNSPNSANAWDLGAMWSNTTHFTLGASGNISVSNSVLVGSTSYSLLPLAMDHNIYWGTMLASGIDTLSDVVAQRTNSLFSMVADPQFVNAAGFDFHGRSTTGRFNQATGLFVTDSVYSATIDFGDPARAFASETSPNGGVMNAGQFGDHPEASRSRTNAWLLAIAYNDGGTLVGTGLLTWAYGNLASSNNVIVQYGSNGTGTWTDISAALPVTNRSYSWVATSAVASLRAYWRVVCEADTNVTDAIDTNFAVRITATNTFRLYVNDTSTNGDVYCTAVSASTNMGLAADNPAPQVQVILDNYDLGGGDVVYIDTGSYTGAVYVLAQDRGTTGTPVVIQGSTNVNAGGTVIERNSALVDAIFLNVGANALRLSDLTVRRSRYAIANVGQSIEFVRVTARDSAVGFRNVPSSLNTFVRCLAISNSIGVELASGSSQNNWDQSISWSNVTAFSLAATNSITVSNSVISGGAAFGSTAPAALDYNIYWNCTIGGGFVNLYDYQRNRNVGWNSTVIDPQFASPATGDFHPRSTAGRYDAATASFTNDAVDSPLIDFGDPARAFTNETAPNGGRLNIGTYGDSAEASRSRTNAWLLALSLNEGGQLSIGDRVYWTANQMPTGATVRIEYSSDSGASWAAVATNLAVTNGYYAWANTNFSSSLFSRWRVVYESNTNVLDANNAVFTLRNGTFRYYVNDTNLVGDIYCGAIGNDANTGTSSNSPMLSLSNLLASVDLEPGDLVYVDTGFYQRQGTIQLLTADSGTPTNPVYIIGSTNVAYGGSTFDRFGPSITHYYTLRAIAVSNLVISDLLFTNASGGMRMESSSGIRLEGVVGRNLADVAFDIANCSSVTLDRCAAFLNGTNGVFVSGTPGVRLLRSVAWRNGSHGVRVDSGWLMASGSVVVASGPRAAVYRGATVTNISGNFNCLYTESNAVMAVLGDHPGFQDTLSAWVGQTGADASSLAADPLFADPLRGDFHLQTQTPQGRYDPYLGLWVNDSLTSLLIDSGDPAAASASEPAPNGGRVNIGPHGGTGEASIGRSTPWLLAVSGLQGGWMRGTATLAWVAGNLATTETVRVDVSTDGGLSWTELSNAVQVTAGRVTWDTTLTNNSPAGAWRVVRTADTNYSDRTTNFFAIRNSALAIYLNDAAVTGDHYTVSAGSGTNWVASASQPLDSLATAIRSFDLEPGDTVYLDTGVYTNDGASMVLGLLDSGHTGSYLRIVGSTNAYAGGTTLSRAAAGSGNGLELQQARAVILSNITVRGAGTGVLVTNSTDLILGVRAVENTTNGFLVRASTNVSARGLVAARNGGYGLSVQGNSVLSVQNGVLWSNVAGGALVQTATLNISNSVMNAYGSGRYIYYVVNTTDTLRANYNDLLVDSSAQVASYGGRILRNLSNLQSDTGQDRQSLSHAPEFANPALDDYHPRSGVGRYQPGTGIVTDLVTSALLDVGDPTGAFAAEPMPNGGRLNIGAFGNTTEASLSRTNGWLLALTVNDGGSLRGTNNLFWVAGGVATGHLVTVQFSADGGSTWTNVATNVAASAGQLLGWDTGVHGSTLAGAWRVVSEVDTGILDRTDNPFTLNNGALSYYVNDSSTNGDVYCTAVGSSANDGTSGSTPAASISDILTRYTLAPGDRILVDTGDYSLGSNLLIDGNTFGGVTNPVVIQGATNYAGGGTVIDRLNGDRGIDISGTRGIRVTDLFIRRARTGLRFGNSTNCSAERVFVTPAAGYNTLVQGIEVASCTGVVLRSCGVSGVTNLFGAGSGLQVSSSIGVQWLDGVLWSNTVALNVSESGVTFSNSVVSVFHPSGLGFYLGQNASLVSDYNNFEITNGALLAQVLIAQFPPTLTAPASFDNLADWTRATGNDRFSLRKAPELANPGQQDFRLQSQGGRALAAGGTVTDLVSSVLIDAGHTNGAFAAEPSPNGGLANIGPYANTADASRSPTQALVALRNLTDGGVVAGTNVTLYWHLLGAATGLQTRVEISQDAGVIWHLIGSNLAAGTRSLVWNTTLFTNSAYGAWRVSAESDTNINDRSLTRFTIRNTNFTFYVNDDSPAGDVYCSAVGISTNTGLSPLSPLLSVEDVLSRYDVEGGDIIYIDTGSYSPTGTIQFGQADSGSATNVVLVQGSTNFGAGGTLFTGEGFLLSQTRGMRIQDISFLPVSAGRLSGVRVFEATNTTLARLTVRSAGTGFEVRRSVLTRMEGCVAVGCVTNGLTDPSSVASVWESGVLWSNRTGVMPAGSGLAISNSIVAAVADDQLAYNVVGTLTSDYNVVYVANGAEVASESVSGRPYPLEYSTVSRWAHDTGRDRHSLSHNPAVANPGTDFHPLSTAGRFDPATTSFVNDVSTSPLVDAGHPAGLFTNELEPNGDRLNIGLYGNTAEASLSPTNADLLAVSYNDGGVAGGTNMYLYWIASGEATGHTVRISFSPDNGATWTNLAVGLPATNGTYIWNSTNEASTVLGLWRVDSEQDTNVWDAVDWYFALRNTPIRFYVNDAETNNDVYCTAPGSALNIGVTAGSPKASIRDVLQSYDLEPGDTIYVDTGSYTGASTIAFGQADSGTTAGSLYITLQGSTNFAAGGTRLVKTGNGTAIDIFDASAIRVRHLTISGADTAVRVQQSSSAELEWLVVEGGTDGILISQSPSATMRNCVVKGAQSAGLRVIASADVVWESGVLWSNKPNGVQLTASSLGFSNSVIGAFGSNTYAYTLDYQSALRSDYNGLFVTSGARVAFQTVAPPLPLSLVFENVSRWARDTGRDRFSYSGDPLFADAASGDFHLLSAGGRFVVATTSFVNDALTSPLVDAGSLSAAFTNETSPNGGRRNVGLFGNTAWASRTPTNAALLAISLNDGGRAEGSGWPMYWLARGAATGHTVRLEIASDTNLNWIVAATNLPARLSTPFLWNSTFSTSSISARWRVVSEQDPNVSDTNDLPFAIRNTALAFYVNDSSASGDIYAAALGTSAGSGTTTNDPQASVGTLLDRYDLEPGDTIYIDTGTYVLPANGIDIGRFDAWEPLTNLTALASGSRGLSLIGSTNENAGGTVLQGFNTAEAISLDEAFGTVLKNLRIERTGSSLSAGLHINESQYVDVRDVKVSGATRSFHVIDSTAVDFRYCQSVGATESGLETVDSTGTIWWHGTLWSNRYGIVQNDGIGTLSVYNTLFGSFGVGRFAYLRYDGTLSADYNCIYRTNSAFAAALVTGSGVGGGTTRYESVYAWVTASGNDSHTLATDPFVADGSASDFHPLSPAGRYVVGVGYVTNGAEAISPLIDAGSPSFAYNLETSPNGGRVDVGIFGNTAQSSLAPTNSRFKILTLNDGGSAQGLIELRWLAYGAAAGHLVTLEFSNDGGATWTNIASGVSGGAGSYLWNSVPYGRAAAGQWRIVSQDEPSAEDVTDEFFALRNGGSIPYYVNDASLSGDVYTTNTGNNAYSGFLPGEPKATLQALLDAVDLEAGDMVYVDTGTYALTADIVVGDLDAGSPTNPVVFAGSTNLVAGGTVLDRQAGVGSALTIRETEGLEFRDFKVTRAASGVSIEEAGNIRFVRLTTVDNEGAGLVASLGEVTCEHCVSRLNSNGIAAVQASVGWHHGIIWDNGSPVVLGDGASVTIRHSALKAVGASRRIYQLAETAGSVTSDYNNLYREDDALVFEQSRAFGNSQIYGTMHEWQLNATQDLHSLTHDPRFIDSSSGDFHLKSATGRYLTSGGLTNDTVYSPLLDAGDPTAVYTNEQAPNGDRLNIGQYGNTPNASLSQTNPWLLALTFNDGAEIRGTVTVYWVSGAMSNGAKVRVEYALDGVDFVPFATNLSAQAGSQVWDVSELPYTDLAKWRVVSESYPGVEDACDQPFIIKNATLVVYVNDVYDTNDVYTTVDGFTTNSGLSIDQPLDSPATALERYNFGPDDLLYIDTGTYSLTSPTGMLLGLVGIYKEAGKTNRPIRIIGSTNDAAGGTVLQGFAGASVGFRIQGSQFVNVENLRFTGFATGVELSDSSQLRLDRVYSYGNLTNGFSVLGAVPALFTRCAAWDNGVFGLNVGAQAAVQWAQGVLWSNRAGATIISGASALFSNSVFHASLSNRYAHTLGSSASVGGDYNFYWMDGGALLAYDSPAQKKYRDLADWQAIRLTDPHSAVLDPLFYDASAGDFHPVSTAGRYDPATALFVTNDLLTSWLIDSGNPAWLYSQEPAPNGARLNGGLYGHTAQASQTVTNPLERALQVVALNDGGQITGTRDLRWYTRALGAGETVRIEFSQNDGVAWQVLATNVAASLQTFTWTPNATNSTPVGRWRVISENTPSLYDTNDTIFAVRVTPVVYYVNDTNLVGDIYTAGPGNPTNDALKPEFPSDSIAAVLDRYDLEGGDQIRVDTGYYLLSDDITVLIDDGGGSTNRVFFTGSTNWMAGGTVIDRASSNLNSETERDAAFFLNQAANLDISLMTIQHANNGIVAERSTGNMISNVLVRDGGRTGITVGDSSQNNTMRRVTITRNKGSGLVLALNNGGIFESGIIWSNGGSAIVAASASISVSNSILHASDTNFCYSLNELGAAFGNFNNLVFVGDANVALFGATVFEGMPQWTAFSTQDVFSLSVDPMFADATNDDFHLRSPYGRFDPATGGYVTTDTNLSLLVDTGPTNWSFALEPEPNGSHLNMGVHGNSSEASKSATNEWLLAITASGGGRANGTFALAWSWGGMSPTSAVTLDFSYDDGTNWLNIVTNRQVGEGAYIWSSLLTPFAVSPIARWRIVKESDTNVLDATDQPFALNGPFRFYVNDTSTVDDVYCTAPGDDFNLGIYSNAPKATIENTFATWDLDGGDEIVVDTGVYLYDSNNLYAVGRSDQGLPSSRVTLRGNTNASGSVLRWTGIDGAFWLVDVEASHFAVADMLFERGGIRVVGTNVALSGLIFTNGGLELRGASTVASDIRMMGGALRTFGITQELSRVSVVNGAIELAGEQVLFRNSVARGTQAVAVVVAGEGITLQNNSLVAKRTAIQQVSADSVLNLRNNIIVADGTDAGEQFALLREGGVVDSDYNNIVVRNGAWIGNANGYWEKLLYWQRASGQDVHSISAEPQFADEVGGDFHLQSLSGRYTAGGVVTDLVHSSSIDLGSPSYPYTNEPAPNGARINLGAYGNTEQASLSLTGAWLFAITMNDGGVLKGTNTIRWAAGNVAPSDTVRLDYSPDAGGSWITFASGVNATGGVYLWASTNVPSSLSGLWRAVLESDTNVLDATDSTFALRNEPLSFFVNDADTTNDVFTTAPGASGNSGTSNSAPKDTISGILAVYDLEGGDTVYVDTGLYSTPQDTLVIWSRSGDATNQLTIRGSTNFAAGGTIINRGSLLAGNDGFEVKASYVTLRDMTVRGAYQGVYVDSNISVRVERMMLASNVYGVAITNASLPVVRNSGFLANEFRGVSIGSSVTSTVENCTFYANKLGAIGLVASLPNVLQNNIFTITTTGTAAYVGSLASTFVDYNVYDLVAPDAVIFSTNRALIPWQLGQGHDYRSAITNPLLANAEGGDFHLKSTIGRWVDGYGWTNDSEDSWAIDKGATNRSYALEPLPNGGRINMGAYGNTEYASLGRTSSTYLVEARILNTPTTIDATNATWPLVWTVINVPTNERFNVQFSGDNGGTWYNLATNVPAYTEVYIWQTSPFFNTYRGRWRVVGINDTNYWDINDAPVQVFYGQFRMTDISYDNYTNRMTWRGAWAEYYQVQYTTNIVSTNAMRWVNAPNGAGVHQQANFLSTNGGDFLYYDPESVTNKHRLYRVLWQQF